MIISFIDELEVAVSLRTLSMVRDDETRESDDANYRQSRQKLESAINLLRERGKLGNGK